VCTTSGCHSATDAFPYGSPHDLSAIHAASPASRTITIDGVDFGVHACSECHTPLDLRSLHGENGSNNSCATCHAPHVSTLLGGATWNKGCYQAGCHGPGSAAPVHGTIDASHTLASAPSCIGDGCHTGGTSVAAIHAAVPGRTDQGCGICHATGVTPTLVCSVCHGAGLPAGHTSHVPTITAGTITINGHAYANQTCSSCHSPYELQQLHGENGTNNSCVKCHPSPATSATSFNCSQPACHTTASGNMKVLHSTLDASHTVSSSLSCAAAGCHGTDVAAIHAGVDTTVSGQHVVGCQACHANPLHSATTDCSVCHGSGLPADHSSHVPTVTAGTITILGTAYPNQVCSRCHTPYELQALHGENGTNNSCVKCHPSPAGSATSFNCSQPACHTTASGNMKVLHATLDASHTVASSLSCAASGCHGTDVAKIHASVDTTISGTHLVSCMVCHANPAHAATTDCSVCHGAGIPADHSSHVPTSPLSGTITIGTVAYTNQTCSTCHAPYELQQLHGEVSHNLASCVKCHPSPASTATSFACSQPACHTTASGNMRVMHANATPDHDTTSVAGDSQCITCHSGTLAAIHLSASVSVSGVGLTSCAVCHSNSTGAVTSAMNGNWAAVFPQTTPATCPRPRSPARSPSAAWLTRTRRAPPATLPMSCSSCTARSTTTWRAA
jgi:hypothetical protein